MLHRRLLCVATAALALLFCLPGCFTVLLWDPPTSIGRPPEGVQQHRSSETVRSVRSEQQLCAPLSPDQRQRLAAVLPIVTEETGALRITLPPDAADQLDEVAAQGKAADLFLRMTVALDGTLRATVDRGVSYPSVPCTVVAESTPSDDLRQPTSLQIEVCRIVDHGSLVWSRILWTPATLVLDAVTLPLQAIGLVVFWLAS